MHAFLDPFDTSTFTLICHLGKTHGVSGTCRHTDVACVKSGVPHSPCPGLDRSQIHVWLLSFPRHARFSSCVRVFEKMLLDETARASEA